MKLREIRAALTDYFGSVERTVTIERYGGKKYVTVATLISFRDRW